MYLAPRQQPSQGAAIEPPPSEPRNAPPGSYGVGRAALGRAAEIEQDEHDPRLEQVTDAPPSARHVSGAAIRARQLALRLAVTGGIKNDMANSHRLLFTRYVATGQWNAADNTGQAIA